VVIYLGVDAQDLGVWRSRLRRGDGMCSLCGREQESGGHLVFDCEHGLPDRGGSGKVGGSCMIMPIGGLSTRRVVMCVGDRVEDFFAWLDRKLCGVG